MRSMAEAAVAPPGSRESGAAPWNGVAREAPGGSHVERGSSPGLRAEAALGRVLGLRAKREFRRDGAEMGGESAERGVAAVGILAEQEAALQRIGDLHLEREADVDPETEELDRDTTTTELDGRTLERERQMEREMEREFREASHALERELERELGRAEKRARRLESDLQEARARASRERAEWAARTSHAERALREAGEAREAERGAVRALEQRNDDLERALRAALSSLEAAEQRLEAALEGSALLEAELEERDRLRVETQRLREEARDLRQELSVVHKQSLSRTPPALCPTVSRTLSGGPLSPRSPRVLSPHSRGATPAPVFTFLQMHSKRRERSQTMGPSWAQSAAPLYSTSRFTWGHDPVTSTRRPTICNAFANPWPPQRCHSQWESRAALRLHLMTLRGTLAPSRFLQLSRLWRS